MGYTIVVEGVPSDSHLLCWIFREIFIVPTMHVGITMLEGICGRKCVKCIIIPSVLDFFLGKMFLSEVAEGLFSVHSRLFVVLGQTTSLG
jgi:hypothetical protein